MPFPKPDRSNKPTVAETIEEIEVERRGRATWADMRKIVVGIAALVALGIGIGTDTWTYIGVVYVILAAAWGIRELIVRRDLRRLRETRRRRREVA